MSKQQTNNFATYKVGLVQPGALSNTQLGPGWYSLSSLSNVPYVTLVGRGGTQKVFTWGELVYIPEGNLVTVKNASYHPGDIFINSGRDFCARPRRITVPFKATLQSAALPTIVPLTPVDVRGAHRAFMNVWSMTDATGAADQYQGAPVPVRWITAGRKIDGSMETKNALPNTFNGGGVGYTYERILPAFSEFFDLPLGWGAVPGQSDTPHTLLDTATAFVLGLPLFSPQTWTGFYTVEY